MADEATLQKDLLDLGFRVSQDRGTGHVAFVMQATPYLSYYVHLSRHEDSLLFTWEFSIGEFMSTNGLQIGANEELNQFLFPKFDARGAMDIAWVVSEMDRAEQILGSLNLLAG
jgi:hypothetical protein